MIHQTSRVFHCCREKTPPLYIPCTVLKISLVPSVSCKRNNLMYFTCSVVLLMYVLVKKCCWLVYWQLLQRTWTPLLWNLLIYSGIFRLYIGNVRHCLCFVFLAWFTLPSFSTTHLFYDLHSPCIYAFPGVARRQGGPQGNFSSGHPCKYFTWKRTRVERSGSPWKFQSSFGHCI